jgi:hypothetical protein
MATLNPIHYNKFKVKVYSPDGELIKTALMNQNHDFFCEGLVPGQVYDIIFTYDNILLLCASFVCNTMGKVVYLNPAHFLLNNQVTATGVKVGSDLALKANLREYFNVPYQLWEKNLISNALANQRIIDIPFHQKPKIIKYKAGSDLASKVK